MVPSDISYTEMVSHTVEWAARKSSEIIKSI